MPVEMQLSSMTVEVDVFSCDARMRGREFFSEPLCRTRKVKNAKQDQHHAHRKLHGQAGAHRNGHAKYDDGRADGDYGEGVAAAPEYADEAGLRDGALPADDGGNSDDVIGIGGMAYTEKKTDGENGESAVQAGTPNFRISKTGPGKHT